MKRKGGDNDITEEEIKMIKKSKIEEKEFFTINIFIISFDILKEIFKFIFYNNKKDMINLRLCCKTFRNLCSPYWKQSIPSLYLNEYLENIKKMDFEIGEMDIMDIIENNYSNIFSKLPQDLTKLTVSKDTNSKDLQYLPSNIEYLNLSKMDLEISFNNIPKTIKFLTLEYEIVESLKGSDLNFIKDFKNPNIYLQKYVDNEYKYIYKPLLFFPIANNDEQYLLYLLEKGANINQKDTDGKNSLMYASRFGHLEIVKLLLKNGADINQRNNNGWNPLMYASRFVYLELVKLLVKNGADINQRDNNGWNPLLYACDYGHLELVKLLIENGADINQKNDNKCNALMIASKMGHLELVEFLFENGADINQRNKKKEDNVLMIAIRFKRFRVVKFLLEKGVDINQKNSDGYNALILAVRKGYLEIVKLLIENDANINEKDNNEKTALQHANEKNQIEIMLYLEFFNYFQKMSDFPFF